jgi:hypothetical protein
LGSGDGGLVLIGGWLCDVGVVELLLLLLKGLVGGEFLGGELLTGGETLLE